MLSRALSKQYTLTRSFGLWSHVAYTPPDPIMKMNAEFAKCESPNKVNLTVGAYRDENGKPWVLPSVKKAIVKFEASDYNLEYLPMNGNRGFTNHALKLAYGENSHLIKENRLASIHTLSGCGAIFMGLSFMKDFGKTNQVWLPNPTWPIQTTCAEKLGYDC